MAGLDGHQIARFSDLLHRLVAGGVPLPAALQQLASELKGSLAEASRALADDVASGRSLAEALAERGEVPPLYVELLAAAERAPGGLVEVLAYIARHADARSRFVSQTRAALLYPLLVGVGCLGVFLFLMSQLGTEMQALERDFGAQGGSLWVPMLVLLGLVLGTLGALSALVASGRRPPWMLRLPMIGQALRAGEAACALRSLQLLIQAGQPAPAALRLATAACDDPALRREGAAAAARLEAGEPFAATVEQVSAWPAEQRWLLASAWSQGEAFPAALAQLADDAEQDADDRARRAALGLELLIVALAGAGVLVVASATYMGMAQMTITLLDQTP